MRDPENDRPIESDQTEAGNDPDIGSGAGYGNHAVDPDAADDE